ncbi:MAG: ribosome maturation factor RimP [Acidimicrobiales bacterium]
MDFETPFRPLLSALGLELYDVELVAGSLNVTVNRPGGVDLAALTAANQALGAWLDEHDPIPGHFTLDVSSPGLERKLRTPEHFAGAIGQVVTLRERREGQPTRRLEGVVAAADERTVTLEDAEHGRVVVHLSHVERARTVFVWGAEAKPSPSRGRSATSTKG